MISFLIENYKVVIGLDLLFYVFHWMIHIILDSSSKNSAADQDPDDQFEVREEWKDFL